MGLDIWQEQTSCKTCGHLPSYETFYCTYNLSPMWYAVYPDAERFVDIDGMRGKKAENRIQFALRYLQDNRDEMIAIQPKNGFGSYDGFCNFLTQLLEQTKLNPKLEWRTFR